MPKNKRKTLTNKLDKLCSELTRSRGSCEKCGQTAAAVKLETHHVYGRANRRLRWDRRNLVCLCFRDHLWAETHPLDFADWFRIRRRGDADYLQKENAKGIKKWTEDELRGKILELNEAAQ